MSDYSREEGENPDVSEIQPWEYIINAEVDWFEEQIEKMLTDRTYFDHFDPAPDIKGAPGAYADLVNSVQLDKYERALLMFLYCVHYNPDLTNQLGELEKGRLRFQTNVKTGAKLPTIESFLQIVLSGDNKGRRKFAYLFDSRHTFYQMGILRIEEGEFGDNHNNRVIGLESDYVDLFMYNEYRVPQFSTEFPATLAESTLTMSEIHLSDSQADKLLEIKTEVEYSEKIRENLGYGNSMTPGYMALFYGEPGTGKTLTAATLGNELEMQVFEVNVSNLVSKYVGETTKNLDRLFKKAAGKGWILVFNEADCLFGKRSHANGDDDGGASHSNQTISYLLDAIPRHRGIIILTTNMRQNFDKAFGRRISNEVHFKPLDTEEAANYLKNYVHPELPLERYDNLEEMLGRQCQSISIASLNNVVHRATRITLMDEQEKIKMPVFERCLKDEIYKTGN